MIETREPTIPACASCERKLRPRQFYARPDAAFSVRHRALYDLLELRPHWFDWRTEGCACCDDVLEAVEGWMTGAYWIHLGEPDLICDPCARRQAPDVLATVIHKRITASPKEQT